MSVKAGSIPAFKQRFTELSNKYETRFAFAENLGLSRQSVNFWLNGDRVPDAKNLITISQKLNVSIDYLLGVTDYPTPDTDKRSVCEYTGLSESAISVLHDRKLDPHVTIRPYKKNYASETIQVVNDLLSTPNGQEILRCIFEFINSQEIRIPIDIEQVDGFIAASLLAESLDPGTHTAYIEEELVENMHLHAMQSALKKLKYCYKEENQG